MFVSFFFFYEKCKQVTVSSQIFLFESVSQKSKTEEGNTVQMVVKVMEAVAASKEDILEALQYFY